MDTSRLRFGAVGVFGATVPIWWSPAIGILALGVLRLMGSPDRISRAEAYAITLMPTFIVGAVSGAVVVAIANRAPLKAWAIFLVSAALGIIVSMAVVDALEKLSEALWNFGTAALIGGSAVAPALAQFRRRRGV